MTKYAWPLPGEGATAQDLLAAEIALGVPGLAQYSLDARRDAIIAELVAAIYNGFGLPVPLIIPGAIQPDADNTAGRVLGTPALRWFDLRAVTATLTTITATNLAGTLTTAAQPNVTSLGTIAALVAGTGVFSGTVSGITTLTATTLAGALSTAAQPNITSLGALTGLTVSAAPLFGVGGSAATAKPSQVLFQSANQATSSASDVSITSYSLLANALNAAGQQVRITVQGKTTGGTGTVHVKLGGTDMGAPPLIGNGDFFELDVLIIYISATNALLSWRTWDNLTLNWQENVAASNFTSTGANLLDMRGSTAAGTITVYGFQVEYLAQ
jgi:hypothetical protein